MSLVIIFAAMVVISEIVRPRNAAPPKDIPPRRNTFLDEVDDEGFKL